MTIIYNTAQVRELDRIAIQEHGIPGLTLMKRAAGACVEVLLERWPTPGHVAVLCGSGNNAGDGFIIAGLLKAKGLDVSVALVGREPPADTDAAAAFAFMQASGVELKAAEPLIDQAGVIVDALLGTGLSGELRPAYATVIERVNAGGVPVLSVDLPSGLDADTGAVRSLCIKADVTVTFIGRKIGLQTNDGPEYAGRVHFAGLGVPDEVLRAVEGVATELDYHQLSRQLPVRHRNAHKVRHGHLLVIGGARGMAGAVTLCGEAALHAGAGMVSVLTHRDNVPVVVSRRPELMARELSAEEDVLELINRAGTIVLGPGLGTGEWGQLAFRLAMDAGKPLVVDADGLNLLAAAGSPNRDNWILTPHPGEAGRLIGLDIQADRLSAVRAIQTAFGGQVLLKGAGTLIAQDDGQVQLCPYGNPGMSVAGMGDVLSGVIGGLLAQGLSPRLATNLGAVVHSLAADQQVKQQGERGLLATELFAGIRRLLNPGL